MGINQNTGVLITAVLVLVTLLAAKPASAQKPGGILKMYTVDSPASMSILEEATVFAERPMMGVFNNLVMFDQHVSRTAWSRSCPTSRRAGRGARTGPN